MIAYKFDLSMMTPKDTRVLTALWSLNFPTLITNDKAMFAGVILGIIVSRFCSKQALNIAIKIAKFISILLTVLVISCPNICYRFYSKNAV